MSQELQISTVREITFQDEFVLVLTKYLDLANEALRVFIAEENNSINGVGYIQGEAMAIISASDVDCEINNMGELIIHATNTTGYSLDENGNLIYSY